MKELAARLSQQYPKSNTGVSVTVTPLLENQVGDYRGSLSLLLGAVALVLLIACANLANLLAARGAARGQFLHLRERFLGGHAFLQSRPTEQPGVIVPRLPHLVVGPAGQREPDFHGSRRKHLRRHHADNRVGLVTKVDRFAEDVRIAVEDPLPKLVADHTDGRSANAIFFFCEHAAELRRETDDLEKGRGNKGTGDLLRRAVFETAHIIRLTPRD